MLEGWSGAALAQSGRDVSLWERAEEAIAANRCGNLIVRVVNEHGQPLKGIPVRFEQKRHAFRFGALYPYDATVYDLLQAAGINAATLWLGWSHVEPRPDLFNWGYLDAVWHPEQLRRRGLALSAHALNWFHDTWNVTPAYVCGLGTRDLPEQVYHHVSALMSRWGQWIDDYELVNEPFWETTQAMDLSLEDMVRVCRATALAVRDQRPTARLSVSFAEISRLQTYRVNPCDLLAALAEADVPVDIIGLQLLENSYTRTEPPAFYRAKSWAGILQAVHKYARFEKPIQITALCAPSLPPPSKVPSYFRPPYGAWDETLQAQYLDLAYTLLYADDLIEGITWWCPVDGRLALVPGGGLLCEDLSLKPSYEALRAWMRRHTSSGQVYTDGDGSAVVVGHAGEYQIVVGTREQGKSLVQKLEPRLVHEMTTVLQ